MYSSFNNDDEINIKGLLQIFLRNKIYIILFLVSGILIGVLDIIISKKVWLGEFQIVLSEKSNNSSKVNSQLADIVGIDFDLDNKTASINTEVEILKSPSILMDIFEFVKLEKNLVDDKIRFKSWYKNLNIELLKGTNVLSISYKDPKKELILPVLTRISNAYQEYSGKERTRNLELEVSIYQ